jgi:hypothetical protein
MKVWFNKKHNACNRITFLILIILHLLNLNRGMQDWKNGVIWIILSLLLASGIATLRWHLLGQNWSAFMVLYENNVNKSCLDDQIITWPDQKYDGQYYFALALNPIQSVATTIRYPETIYHPEQTPCQKIYLDNPVLRTKRIGYPLLAWAASGFGKVKVLPFVLVALNILGIALAVGACFFICRAFDAPIAYSLMPLLFIGLWMCLFRDLADQLGIALGVTALAFLIRNNLYWFAILGIAAMLTKETVVFILLGGGISYGIQLLRRQRFLKILVAALPFLVYLSWSTIIGWGADSDGTLFKHFDWPFAGMVKGYKLAPLPVFWWGAWIPVAVITLESFVILWKKPAAIKSATGLAFVLNFLFVILMSMAIYEDPFSFARNILPLQYAALLLILEHHKKVHWATIAISLFATLFFIRDTILHP